MRQTHVMFYRKGLSNQEYCHMGPSFKFNQREAPFMFGMKDF